jgi:hypothetical protein
MAEIRVITKEADLWSLLEAETSSTKGQLPIDSVHIDGWQPRLLYFPDARIGHSVSPSIARAISGFHTSLSRSYAYMIYGDANARRLKTEDLEVLDIQMLVVSGSNGFDVMADALDRLSDAVVHKLTGQQMAVLLAIFLLLNFSGTVAKEWLSTMYAERARDTEIQEHIKLSEQETQRMQILASVIGQNPCIKPIEDIAAEGRPPLVRSVIPQVRGNIFGTEITREQASIIVSKERTKGEGQRFDGCFEVVDINIDNPDGHYGVLKNTKTGQEVRAAINSGELSKDDIDALFQALHQKKCVIKPSTSICTILLT